MLTFLGASGTVTGSRFLIESVRDRVLVDAGLYQGSSEVRRLNWDSLPVPPAELDAVVVTHAHLDHSGYLPRLVRAGFKGEILCTPETAALVAIVLRDSAHLQEEDARYAELRGWSRHHPPLPLYTSMDVEQTLPLLTAVPFGERRLAASSMSVTLRPAGHILGSAIAQIEVAGESVVFSGDLGRSQHPLLRAPVALPRASTLVIESTYGDRHHPPADPALLSDAICRTVARGGAVLVPAFAVDRTELVLLELRRLAAAAEIPRVPVYVDSPMALAALEVYRKAVHSGSPQLRGRAKALDDLDRLDLHLVRDAAMSEQLNSPRSPCIIISASGMAAGGRVVHHLTHQLPDPRNSVVLTGYQAEGTPGRQLKDGARHLRLHGRYLPVRAEVVDVPDFSVHADSDELVEWVASAPSPPRTVFVVHGEPPASRALARRIETELGICAVVPKLGERVRLD